MTPTISETILAEVSPSGRWSLLIYTTPDTPYLRADLINLDHSVGCCSAIHGISFGPHTPVSVSELSVRWDLPDNVLGLFVGTTCYGLFRCGAGRRRNRGTFRTGLAENAFTDGEIDWFCATSHVQYRHAR